MNNTKYRINGALGRAETQVELLRTLDVSDAKDLLANVKDMTREMSKVEAVLKLVSGQEIGDKAYADILERQPDEYTEAVAAGAVFASKAILSDKVDPKTGAPIYRIVWRNINAEKVRKALSTKKGESLGNDRDGAEMVVNRADLRRANITHRKNAVKQFQSAAKIVKLEKIAAVHDAKKTVAANIYALGQRLIDAEASVQKVVVTA